MKKRWVRFEHGKNTEVYEEKTGICLCQICLQRYEHERKQTYEYFADLKKEKQITIGGEESCQIRIQDPFFRHRSMSIFREEGVFWAEGHTWEMFKNGHLCRRKSRLRDHDFLEFGGYRFYFLEEKLFFDSEQGIECHGICGGKRDHERFDYPDYLCRARWAIPYPDGETNVIAPENFPSKPENRLFLSLFSSVSMMGMFFLFQREQADFAGKYRIAMGGMAVLTAFVTWIYTNVSTLHRQRQYMRRYRMYLKEKEEELSQKRTKERDFLRSQERSWRELLEELKRSSWKMFEKSPKDWDFLCVRMGDGTICARNATEFQKKEDIIRSHTLWEETQEMISRQNQIKDAPVLFDLPAFGVSGIVGQEQLRVRFLEMILFEVVCSHAEEDVKILLWGEEQSICNVRWLRLLPHIRTKKEERLIGWEKNSRVRMLEKLEEEIEVRKAEKRTYPAWIVCFFEEAEGELQSFLKKISEAFLVGIYPIFLSLDERALPRGCHTKICLEGIGDATGRVGDTILKGKLFCDGWGQEREFWTDLPEKEVFIRAARMLSTVRQRTASREQKLPEKITLLELLEKEEGANWKMGKRWQEERETLAVPIGVTENGSSLFLDLHEKADGPHGLVAGTTGSGKSEMILTYLLLTAVFFPPWRIQFLLIDFKGGGLANHLKGLPHLAGTITNLEESSLERSLSFIRAELKKRQRMLAQFQCSHVDEYVKLYQKNPREMEAMPHLVLIVDEFAELKAEQPEFMKELISASRIGRSLGVHLILATQKPSGQVSEQIWSNTTFRLCLKVQSQNDSREVLHCPLAAQITEAGRGYFQVGNQEGAVLFQSAYSSEKMQEDCEEGFQIFQVLLGGERCLFYEKKAKVSEGWTQAEMIRKYVIEQWEKEYRRKLPTVCLEPLREEIFYPCEKEQIEQRWEIPIGIYDDPQRQRQPQARIEMRRQNLFVTGGTGSGKQNLFLVLLRGLAEQMEEVEIYIADFEGRIPKVLENLPQIGGIVSGAEEEKLENLVEMIEDEMKLRRQRIEEHEMTPMMIVWFSYAEWRTKYPDLESRIAAIMREGIRLDISTMIFQEETGGIGHGIFSGFGSRIALYHPDTMVYRQMLEAVREKLPRIPGRGFFQKENQIYQVQIYQAFRGRNKKEQLLTMEDWIWECCERTNRRARKIPCIPEQLCWETYPLNRKKGQVPIALKFEHTKTVFWEECKKKITGICGEGQEKWISQILRTWEIFREKVKFFVLDDQRERLKWMELRKEVCCYTKDGGEVFEALHRALDSRGEEMLILILNGMTVLSRISDEKILYQAMWEYAEEAVVLCTNVENKAIRYQSPRIVQDIKERGQVIFFGKKKEIKLIEIPFGQLKRCKERKDESEVFFWDGSCLEKWKMATEGI
ncbi:MAG: FtsK/SpoIIIE domain-containing protein [Lachnospiraceae bacterium]|nr:hypothetical protein [Robinsoniella sp.]MDY3767305.1 FtsK/SpoIIIE domain-containing protein [Lachnospiraceae bacterium]